MEDYKKTLRRTIMLVLLLLIGISGISLAWFTMADHTRVSSMSLDITNGSNLRFDVVPHEDIEDYYKTLNIDRIREYVLNNHGYDLTLRSLEPVTTVDYETFTFEKGDIVDVNDGAYLEFPLHFMAAKDMYIHLTAESSNGNDDGTLISADDSKLTNALRVCFSTDGYNYIYNPGMSEGSVEDAYGKMYGLNDENNMVYSDDNRMFFLKAFENKEVRVKIWLEGTDEGCTDDIRKMNFSMKFRFAGTDEDNKLVE